MVVLEVQVRREPPLALLRAVVLEAIRPFSQQGLDEPLGLSVRAWRVGASALVANPGCLAPRRELRGRVLLCRLYAFDSPSLSA